MTRKVIKIHNIICLILFYLGVSSIFPPIDGYLGNMNIVIRIALNMALLLVAFTNQKKCFVNLTHLIGTVFFVFYSAIVPYLFGNGVWANRYLDLSLFITAPLMYNYLYNTGHLDALKKYVVLTFVFAAITWVITVSSLLASPYISRLIKSSGELTTALKRRGIGGYEFIYFCMIICVAAFNVFGNYNKLSYLLLTILMLITLILGNYMIAFLLSIIGIILNLLAGRTFRKRCISLSILLALLIFYNPLLNCLIDLIIKISPSGRIAELLKGSSANIFIAIWDEFKSDRLPTLLGSLLIIGETNGLGSSILPPNELDYILRELGQHSHILDTLAIMGVPVGLLYTYLIFRPLKVNKSLIFIFPLLLLFNNATCSQAYAIYIIAPLLEYIYRDYVCT